MEHRHTSEARALRRKLAAGLIGLGVLVACVIGYYVSRGSVDVFSSAGPVATREKNLILLAGALSLIVVIPVFILTFLIVWRYRETNTRARYDPDFDHSPLFETIWWLIPFGLISILAVVAWQSSHSLDPYRPLQSSQKPLTVQVVALQWRWLFLYPEQHVASLNYVMMPVNRPVRFEITADAPMNSFWLPKLGGQIYAMAGMETQLNLMASKTGEYRGVSANISGTGFSDMTFTARAVPQSAFDSWVTTAKQSAPLAMSDYKLIARPSTNHTGAMYTLPSTELFSDIMMPYMMNHGGHAG
jgi:cytochrome o ubiquinol oxidase subunit 2